MDNINLLIALMIIAVIMVAALITAVFANLLVDRLTQAAKEISSEWISKFGKASSATPPSMQTAESAILDNRTTQYIVKGRIMFPGTTWGNVSVALENVEVWTHTVHLQGVAVTRYEIYVSSGGFINFFDNDTHTSRDSVGEGQICMIQLAGNQLTYHYWPDGAA